MGQGSTCFGDVPIAWCHIELHMGKRLTKLPLSLNDHGHLHDNSMGKPLHGVLTTTASGRPCMAIGVITISECLSDAQNALAYEFSAFPIVRR